MTNNSQNPEAETAKAHQPEIAVVVPVHNEEGNLEPLIAEIVQALDGIAPFEIIYVDDGSTDTTVSSLKNLAEKETRLRVLVHQKCCGQSAAVATGIRYAKAPLIATLDGDGQNDPSDIPALMKAWKEAPDNAFLLIAGHRVKRQDSGIKKVSSRVANKVRAFLLKDATPDTGCGLKVFARSAFMDLPRFDHMHRYLPALFMRAGGRVNSIPVNHRHRERGTSKYGTLDRLAVAVFDLIGVIWLRRRGSCPALDQDRSVRPTTDGGHP